MIRRLIILLLIVGCSTEPQEEIKEVSWVLYKNPYYNNSNVGYWVEGYEPNNNLNDNLNDNQNEEIIKVSHYFGIDSASCINESKRILHYTKLSYFEILDVIPNVFPITNVVNDENEYFNYYCHGNYPDESSININLYAEDYEIIQYEYK